MKKAKEPMSITKQYSIRYFFNGLAWLLFSIFNLSENQIVNFIGSMFMLLAAICTFITLLPNRESDDEMSLKHIRLAKSISLDLTVLFLMAVGVCSLFPQNSINYKYIYGFIISVSQIISGVLFHMFEKGEN
jgi:uncharacterized membrane protein